MKLESTAEELEEQRAAEAAAAVGGGFAGSGLKLGVVRLGRAGGKVRIEQGSQRSSKDL